MSNTNQIEFLKTVLHGMNLATAAKSRIIAALKIGGIVNEKEAIQYAEDLQNFIDAAIKIGWQTQIGFGEQSATIASDFLESNEIKN